ncbi:MAG: alginate lyase family protein [Rhodothermales bacterium]
MRDQIDEEPYASAARALQKRAEAALALEPQSVTAVGGVPESGDVHDFSTAPPYAHPEGTRDGVVNPKADRADYSAVVALSQAVRDLAPAHAVTGQARYAQKALTLIRFWCLDPETRMNPRFTNHQSQIELSISVPALFYGASVLWDDPGWTSEEKEAFWTWAEAFRESGEGWTKENNFENWRLVFLASAAALLGDEAALQDVFAAWKGLLDRQVAKDGSLPHELSRAGSLGYSTYALNAMVQTAEIARHHGADLYGYVSPKGRSLEQVLAFHAPYVIDPAAWPYKQIKPYKGENGALYEVAHAATGHPLYLRVVQHLGRPLYESRVMGPVTLTHGEAE